MSSLARESLAKGTNSGFCNNKLSTIKSLLFRIYSLKTSPMLSNYQTKLINYKLIVLIYYNIQYRFEFYQIIIDMRVVNNSIQKEAPSPTYYHLSRLFDKLPKRQVLVARQIEKSK